MLFPAPNFFLVVVFLEIPCSFSEFSWNNIYFDRRKVLADDKNCGRMFFHPSSSIRVYKCNTVFRPSLSVTHTQRDMMSEREWKCVWEMGKKAKEANVVINHNLVQFMIYCRPKVDRPRDGFALLYNREDRYCCWCCCMPPSAVKWSVRHTQKGSDPTPNLIPDGIGAVTEEWIRKDMYHWIICSQSQEIRLYWWTQGIGSHFTTESDVTSVSPFGGNFQFNYL